MKKIFLIFLVIAPLTTNALEYEDFNGEVNAPIQKSFRITLNALQKCKSIFDGAINGQFYSDINEGEILQWGFGDASGMLLEKYKFTQIENNKTKITFSTHKCLLCNPTDIKLKKAIEWIDSNESECPKQPEISKPNFIKD